MRKWEPDIRAYMSYLKLEKGLAENSVKAYENDLKKLLQFLKKLVLKVVRKKLMPDCFTILFIGSMQQG